MSEIRKIRIATDDKGFTHVYVVGTDIEIGHITGLSVHVESNNHFRPIATLEVDEPEIDMCADVQVETTVSYRRLNL